MQVSIANQRESRGKELNNIFGELYIHAIPFIMRNEEKSIVDA
jgi:hypothetical protein